MPSRGTATGAWFDQRRNQNSREHLFSRCREITFGCSRFSGTSGSLATLSAAGIDAAFRVRRQSKNLFTNSSIESAEKSSKKGSTGFLVSWCRKLVLDLRAAKRRVGFWFGGIDLQLADEWKTFVGIGLWRTYRQGKNLVWQLEMIGQENASDETWHELRKCAKALGYQLRILRPIWPGPIIALLHEMDQLTDRLGDDHDLAVLTRKDLERALQRFGDAEFRRDPAPLPSIPRSTEKKIQLESLQLARRIYVEKPSQFEHRLAAYWHDLEFDQSGQEDQKVQKRRKPCDETSRKVHEPSKTDESAPDVIEER